MRSADTPQDAAALLTKSAFAAGSLDNLTAVVVALRGYKAGDHFVPSPIERGFTQRDGRRLSPLWLALSEAAAWRGSPLHVVDAFREAALVGSW